MRLSKLISKTQREIPAEADTISHQLLLRTGMIHQVAAGVSGRRWIERVDRNY